MEIENSATTDFGPALAAAQSAAPLCPGNSLGESVEQEMSPIAGGERPADSPSVTVIIVYYKRRETILDCLNSIFQQDYPAAEVILVDNHSEDDLRTVVSEWLGRITLIELSANLGASAARNAAIRSARGQILVFLDDDAGFISPDGISSIVELFRERPGADVLALQICDAQTGATRPREWCHPFPLDEFGQAEFETNYFGEGACAFRRKVFDIAGLYYEPMFYYGEEGDLVVRLLDKGFRILHTPQVRVWHRASATARSSDRQFYYFTRHYIWMSYKDYRWTDGLRYLAPKMLMMMYFTLRTRRFGPFCRGVRDGLMGLRRVHADRTPVSKETIRYIAGLESNRPGWRKRLQKHHARPLL